MAPVGAQNFLSPAELSFVSSSLRLSPPIRPDGRSATQFRPVLAESDILPNTNGSARVCFDDGTEAVVGVKAEVEKSAWRPGAGAVAEGVDEEVGDDDEDEGARLGASGGGRGVGENAWVEMSVEVPGYRTEDALLVFVAAMLTEALLASGDLKDRLYINRRVHWKLYVDVSPSRSCNSFLCPPYSHSYDSA